MDLAIVVGRVVCSAKDQRLRGVKLLLVRPIDPDGQASGSLVVALDAVGAGAGETVFYTTGREASFAFLPEDVPSDATVVGIVDSVHRRDAS
jgi:microcompartment protein CcmK/EutM